MNNSLIQNTLQHYGILGMQWGKRKARGPSSSEHTTASELKKKKAHELTNEEIRQYAARVALEKQYKDLTATRVQRGKAAAASILATSGKQVLTAATTAAMMKYGKELLRIAAEKKG